MLSVHMIEITYKQYAPDSVGKKIHTKKKEGKKYTNMLIIIVLICKTRTIIFFLLYFHTFSSLYYGGVKVFKIRRIKIIVEDKKPRGYHLRIQKIVFKCQRCLMTQESHLPSTVYNFLICTVGIITSAC